MKQDCNLKSCVRKGTSVFLCIIAVVAVFMLFSSIKSTYFDKPKPKQQETTEEILPLPELDNQKQGSPEISKLNPDSQVKEGW